MTGKWQGNFACMHFFKSVIFMFISTLWTWIKRKKVSIPEKNQRSNTTNSMFTRCWAFVSICSIQLYEEKRDLNIAFLRIFKCMNLQILSNYFVCVQMRRIVYTQRDKNVKRKYLCLYPHAYNVSRPAYGYWCCMRFTL